MGWEGGKEGRGDPGGRGPGRRVGRGHEEHLYHLSSLLPPLGASELTVPLLGTFSLGSGKS